MRKTINIIKIILLVVVIINILGAIFNTCYALKDVAENPELWKPTETGDTGINKKIDIIVTVIRTIGIFVSVGTVMIIGIKYMLGSVEEKAGYKQKMLPWLLGACMVFSITLLPSLIFDMTYSPVNSAVDENYDYKQYEKGYLSGYTQGIIFLNSWNGTEESLNANKNMWNSSIRNNSETNGKADGALAALNKAHEPTIKNFCEGYMKANSWANAGKTKEQLQERLNKVSNGGATDVPAVEIAGYCQRLQLQINTYN